MRTTPIRVFIRVSPTRPAGETVRAVRWTRLARTLALLWDTGYYV